MSKYLFLDTETGGIGLDKSLLSVGIVITDENFNELYSYQNELKPKDGVYHVDGKAMSINKIDLVKHDSIAITYDAFTTNLFNTLNNYSAGGKEKIVVCGKNVYFDLTHMWDKLIKRNTWEQFCSYQTVDLTAIWKFLEMTGKVSILPKTSLNDIAVYLGVELDNNSLHTALYDAKLTLTCFRVIKERFS